MLAPFLAKLKQINLEDLPPEVVILLGSFANVASRLTRSLKAGNIDEDEWGDSMASLITRYHLAGWMLGQDDTVISDADNIVLLGLIKSQMDFLNNFKLTVQGADEFLDGWIERSESYALAVNSTYWQGRTKFLPLPAMPGQGTQCLTNCKCEWRIETISEENGDYDAYWELEPGAEHCQTCLQRAADWSPVEIRGGQLI